VPILARTLGGTSRPPVTGKVAMKMTARGAAKHDTAI
jgi:hypothetical protein